MAGIAASAITAPVDPFLTASANRAVDAKRTWSLDALLSTFDLNRVAIREEGLLERVAEPYLARGPDEERIPNDPLTLRKSTLLLV